MIELKQISKRYGEGAQAFDALQGVSLHVPEGAVYGVVGASGAGKSTLVRCINLLERPSSGSVRVAGQELTTLSAAELRQARHRIGMIFQHFNLLESRSVSANIALPLALMGMGRREQAARVAPLLELTGLADKADQYPAQLSGGQKQRVAIARALASEPQVLLCDEATSALDPETTASILSLLQAINRRLGLTIVLITHEMEVVKRICDRVALLDRGRLIEEASVEGFFAAPQTALGQRFVATALSQALPREVERMLQPESEAGSRPLVRMTFVGDSVQQPLIFRTARRFQVDFSILQSNIEYLRSKPLGYLTAEIQGEAGAVSAALAYLQTQPVNLEVLGYVRRDAATAA